MTSNHSRRTRVVAARCSRATDAPAGAVPDPVRRREPGRRPDDRSRFVRLARRPLRSGNDRLSALDVDGTPLESATFRFRSSASRCSSKPIPQGTMRHAAVARAAPRRRRGVARNQIEARLRANGPRILADHLGLDPFAFRLGLRAAAGSLHALSAASAAGARVKSGHISTATNSSAAAGCVPSHQRGRGCPRWRLTWRYAPRTHPDS